MEQGCKGFLRKSPLVPRLLVVPVIVNTLISDMASHLLKLCHFRQYVIKFLFSLQAAAEYAKILAQRQKEAKEARELKRKRSASLRESKRSVSSQ